MDELKKMLISVVNSQSSFREEVISELKKVKVEIRGLKHEIGKSEERLTKRIDKIGRQVAYLEDDTPTRSEYDSLERRVLKVEKKLAM